MRVTIVSPSAYPVLAPGNEDFAGGAEFQLLMLARALKARGHEVSFVVGDHGQAERVEIEGMAVHRSFRQHEGNRKLRFLPDMWKLRKAIRASRPEVVNQRSTAFYTGQTCAFAHEFGAAFIFSLGIDYNCYPNLLGRAPKPIQLLYAWGIRNAEMVLAQTAEQAELMRENFACRELRVLPNMIRLPEAIERSGRRGPVLWVGSLARRKRPELFVEAARALPEYEFRIVGGPGEDPGYDREIQRLASGVPNLEMVGFVRPDEMDAEYGSAWVYVNTSGLEGLPNAFLQAWSHGVPAVSVSVDPDGVIAAKNLGRVSGTPEALVPTLQDFLRDSATVEAAGERARDHVRLHDVESLGEFAERCFLDAMASRRR